ncbi:nucleotidyltransferase family protein [Nocardioides litoris]|uniref:nucleotidyltransferase family protein n=1 Tax=Nocardioides litoris TaxID=1926648 RepID=UPI0014771BFD|nr:nucleotidyltransferase family protein [Nocardioides litoris]
MTDAPSLTLDEGVELGYALVLRVAADAGVRALPIKGPVLSRQGLRAHRSSADVDVLVDPAGLPRVQAALEAIGWHDDGFYDTPGIVPWHSVNHRHPQWPCEVDLHHWFPGFLADPGVVFDVLWARRTTVELAARSIDAPDVVAHAAIIALHHLRDGHDTYKQGLLVDLAAVVAGWTDDRRDDLARLAAATGASHALAPFLQQVGVPVLAATVPLAIPTRDWDLRSQTHTTEVFPWLVGLSRTPWHRRPAFVWQAWRTGDQAVRRAGESDRRAVAAARRARLRRAARAMPDAVREYRRLRRG